MNRKRIVILFGSMLLLAIAIVCSLYLSRKPKVFIDPLLPPPRYLSVPNFKSCALSELVEPGAGYEVWCLPKKKSSGCSEESWMALKGKLPPCRQVG